MNMDEYDLRMAFVTSAEFWLGSETGSARHKQIIDIYNGINPLPRGYKVKYTDPWCATFVSSVAWNCGMSTIFPFECSCYYMLQHLIKTNQWVEDDNYIPSIGDLIFYDWSDSEDFEVTDNINVPQHVGIVATVHEHTFSIIEGNYSNSVKKRAIKQNGKYIRGFGHLDFASIALDDELIWCTNVGIFQGDENGNMNWKNNITREEVARVISRLYNLLVL